MTHRNIGRLKVNEEKIASDETKGYPNSKAKKPKYGTKETHRSLNSRIEFKRASLQMTMELAPSLSHQYAKAI